MVNMRLLQNLVFMVLFAAFWATGAVAAEVSYGGRLTDASGKPLAGPVDLEFRFFDQVTAGTQLGPVFDADDVVLKQGVFNEVIQIADADTPVIFGGAAVWIQVKDKGANKVLPRQRFLAVPYALRVPIDNSTLHYDANGKLRMGPVAPGVGSFLKIDAAGVLSWEAGGGGAVAPDTVATSSIQDDAVVNAKVADDAVDGSKILDGSIGDVDIAALDAAKLTGNIAYARLPTGTVANTVAAGNDARFTDARAPTGAAGGVLTGTYPNPGINLAVGDIPTLTSAKVSDFAAATAAAETDPQVGANTTNYVPKWNGSALVAGSLYDSGGNVGIGTTSPSASLDIVRSSGSPVLALTSGLASGYSQVVSFSDTGKDLATGIFGSTKTSYAGVNANEAYVMTDTAGTNLVVSSTGQQRFHVNGAPRMTIDTAGNVGIGTPTPLDKLSITDSSAANDATKNLVRLEGGADVTLGPVVGLVGVHPSASGNSRYFYIGGGDSAAMRTLALNTNGLGTFGNVAIGTTYSGYPLNIYKNDASGSAMLVLDQDGTGNSSIMFRKPTVRNWNIGLDNGDANKFKITMDGSLGGGTNMFTIDSTGNVGIATSGPTEKLHVAGAIRMVDGNEAAGKVLVSSVTGVGSWQTTPGGGDSSFLIVDQKATGTDGGTFSNNAWRTRDLNTVKWDAGSNVVSLASNQFVLNAGTYECTIAAPAHNSEVHLARLQNITDGTTIATGTSARHGTITLVTSNSTIITRFTIGAAKTLEVQHRTANGSNNDGFGKAANFPSTPETYTTVYCRRIQ